MSNHLGDTNKMVETPRTDVLLIAHDMAPTHISLISHARELERELNAANERIKRLEEMYEGVIGERPEFLGSNVMGLLKRELNTAQRRIKRLEEAGDKIVESGWSVQDWSGMCVVWAKAKEDKL